MPTAKTPTSFLFDLAAGKSRNLTPHEGDHLYYASDVSPDGKTALITSDAHNGYWNVGLLDIATGNIDWLTNDKWETRSGAFSPDGRSLCWTANIDGQTAIYGYNLATKQTQPLPLKSGVNTLGGNLRAYSPDGSKLLFYHQGGDAPNDAWTYDIASRQSQQVTHALIGGLRSSDMVQPYLVHFPSRDGKFTISASFTCQTTSRPRESFPPSCTIHGGPASQFVDGFDPLIQYIVNQGYLVIAPNYRGSSGYGKEFMLCQRSRFGRRRSERRARCRRVDSKSRPSSIPRSWSSWAPATAAISP